MKLKAGMKVRVNTEEVANGLDTENIRKMYDNGDFGDKVFTIQNVIPSILCPYVLDTPLHTSFSANELIVVEEKKRADSEEEKAVEKIEYKKPEIFNPGKTVFCFPITVSVFDKSNLWDEDCDDHDGKWAYQYQEKIEKAFKEYQDGFEDMEKYFGEERSKTAKKKIVSIKWGFVCFDSCLFGKVSVISNNPFTDTEIEELKDWIEGQNSDGIGEGFEQKDIEIGDEMLNVHFWNEGKDYKVCSYGEFVDEYLPEHFGKTKKGEKQ